MLAFFSRKAGTRPHCPSVKTTRILRARRRQPGPRLGEQLEQRVVFDASGLFSVCAVTTEHDQNAAEESTAFLADPVFAPGTPPEVIAAYDDLDNHGGFAEFNFTDNARWSRTTTSGTGLSQGDPTIITWSFADDGTAISGYNGEPAAPSNLQQFLAGIYGTNPSSSPEDQPWFTPFQQVFDRWSAVSGITYVYEPNDDGAALGSGAGGVLGVRGDVRLSGHRIDGPGNILAYNFFPTVGDMVLDTGDTYFNSTSNNSLRLRNTVAHEAGHGIGLGHVTPTNGTKLMEPSITLGFDGPQADDILAANRGYGDRLEKNGGNNTAATAYNLGSNLTTFTVDTVSIDDDSDTDYFRFTVGGASALNVTVTPTGSTYTSNSVTFNSLAQSNLALSVYGTNGTTVIASANVNAAGVAESLANVVLPGSGTYYVRITGDANAAQMYRLNGTINSTAPPVPAPEIQTLDGSTDIADGSGSVAYGSTVAGTAVTKTFAVANIGTQNLVLGSSIQLPTGFTLAQAFGTTTVAPGASTTFVVSLNSAVAGSYSGQISFTTNDSDENPFNFTVSGTVTAAPTVPTLPFTDNFNRANNTAIGSDWTERVGDLVVNANVLRSNVSTVSLATINTAALADVVVEADVNIGTGSSTRSFGLVTRYSGSGDGNWYLGNIRYTGGQYNAEIWKQSGGSQTLLSAQTIADGSVNVRFEVVGSSLRLFADDVLVGSATDTQLASGGAGVRSNFVTGLTMDNFSVSTPGTPVPAAEIQVLNGTADIADNTGTVNYGSATSGTPLTTTFTVRNTGTANLTLGAVQVPTGYSLVQPFGSSTVAPGASTTFAVSLNATAAGTYTGQISFATNDADENPFNFNVTGTITAAPAAEIAVLDGATNIADNTGTVNFGSTVSGTALTKTFTVSNTGNGNLTLNPAITLPAGYTLAQGFGTTTVAPGTSTTFVVSLSTTTAGTYAGQISFATNDSDENPFNFNVTGTITASTTPGLPFADNFNRANSTSLGSNWTERIGDLTINANTLRSNTSTVSLATVTSPATADMVLAADVNIGTGTATRSAALVARYSGSGDGNWYLGNLRYNGVAYQAEIWKQVNGAQTLLSATSVGSGTGNVRFEVVGTSLKLFFNNALVGNVTDSQLASGMFGVRTNFVTGLSIDNYSASTPSSSSGQSPEIQVSDGSSDILDNTGLVNFGATTSGTPLTKTFTVANTGTADLTLGPATSLPSGYSLAQPFGSTTLAPGASTTFAVTLNATAAGTHSGQVSFTNNDSDESTFNFAITGSVTVASPGLPFADDFNRASSTALGSSWTERAGDLAISASSLVSSNSSISLATVQGIDVANVVLTADYNVGTGSATRSAALVARYSAGGDWYLANIRYSDVLQAEIWKQVGGVQTLLSQTAISSTSGNIQFEVVGTTLRMFVNGTLVGNVTDSQLASGGVGVRTNFATGLRFDNFTAATAASVQGGNSMKSASVAGLWAAAPSAAYPTHTQAVDQTLASLYGRSSSANNDNLPWWLWDDAE